MRRGWIALFGLVVDAGHPQPVDGDRSEGCARPGRTRRGGGPARGVRAGSDRAVRPAAGEGADEGTREAHLNGDRARDALSRAKGTLGRARRTGGRRSRPTAWHSSSDSPGCRCPERRCRGSGCRRRRTFGRDPSSGTTCRRRDRPVAGHPHTSSSRCPEASDPLPRRRLRCSCRDPRQSGRGRPGAQEDRATSPTEITTRRAWPSSREAIFRNRAT
jgi:hypothetical protein